ncbi:MAG: GNAT family N-acetyltransferase, partial [ANME-2 cluster archaeon]|nr:GNAT family N-acetyltransferase [ANME-2 cluster archaeon]
MEIIDLTDEHTPLYLLCLEDWSDEIKEAGTCKERWYGRMKEKGFRVKLALDDAGEVGGMIQYGPIEHSFADGNGLYFIYCIWVHGYKEGRGNFQKKGMGKALIKAAEDDARNRGAQGMAAWGMLFPFWMKASWFRKQGYSKADRQGISVLLWKPFTDTVEPPRWIRQQKKPETVPGKVTVTAFVNGWCQAQNMVYERAKRAAAEFGDEVVFREIDTSDRDVLMEWGISDALFMDEKEVRTGPPPSYEKIYKL